MICRCRLARTAFFGIDRRILAAPAMSCALQAFSRNTPTQIACAMLGAAERHAVIWRMQNCPVQQDENERSQAKK